MEESEKIATIVRPALERAYAYDVSDHDAAVLLHGGTVWARIMGESANIHLCDHSGAFRVVMGRAR